MAPAGTIANLIKQPAALDPLKVLAWRDGLVVNANDPRARYSHALELLKRRPEKLKSSR